MTDGPAKVWLVYDRTEVVVGVFDTEAKALEFCRTAMEGISVTEHRHRTVDNEVQTQMWGTSFSHPSYVITPWKVA